MGYYLSKIDQESILHLYPQLDKATEDVTYQTKYPTKLAYVLRNAFHVIPNWSKFLIKFKVITREDRVILRLRQTQFELSIPVTRLLTPTIFEILDTLLKSPDILELESLNIDDSEFIKLTNYCKDNNYDIIRTGDNSFRVEKKGIRS